MNDKNVIFTSHRSHGESILTLTPPGKSKPDGPSSIFDLSAEDDSEMVIILEHVMSGFPEAQKGAVELGKKLVFGIRFHLSPPPPPDEKPSYFSPRHGVNVFALNDDGFQTLSELYSHVMTGDRSKGTETLFFDKLQSSNLLNIVVSLPFYSSFLARNALSFSGYCPPQGFLDCCSSLFIESHNLPKDEVLTPIVRSFSKSSGMALSPVRSVYYARPEDVDAFVTYKLACSRTPAWSKRSLSNPNLDGFGSDTFSFFSSNE
jgi:DNA polymerase III alpha subunit